MANNYRHQDTEAQKGLLTNGVPSCLCAFAANFSACTDKDKIIKSFHAE
jgi:hypothetical protein